MCFLSHDRKEDVLNLLRIQISDETVSKHLVGDGMLQHAQYNGGCNDKCHEI